MKKAEPIYPLANGATADRPIWQMPIPLTIDEACVCWPDGKDRTPKASSDNLRQAIARSVGQHVPNQHLASLGPGDVVVVTDGLFWITPEWKVVSLPADIEEKAKEIIARW